MHANFTINNLHLVKDHFNYLETCMYIHTCIYIHVYFKCTCVENAQIAVKHKDKAGILLSSYMLMREQTQNV